MTTMSNTVYNLNQLHELAGGSDDFVQSMVETFLEHTPQQLQELLNAYKAHDLITVGSIAHKIKPNIDLFGIEAIKENVRTVEEKGKNEINDAELRESVDRLKKYLELSFIQLKER